MRSVYIRGKCSGLKRYTLVVALILLLAGAIFAMYSNFLVIEFDKSRIEHKDNAREISGFFEKGEKIVVEFWPAEEWQNINLLLEKIDGVDRAAMFIYFNVTGPSSNAATFEVTLVRGQTGQYPAIYEIRVEKVGDITMDLKANNQTSEIGGVVNASGNYTALIDFIAPPTVPPQYIELYKGIPQKRYPYYYLLPIGTAVLASGLILLFWSSRTSKKVTRLKKSIREENKQKLQRFHRCL